MVAPTRKKKAGWFRYLKEAFTFRWNLLLFGGAAAAAVISGRPEIGLPLVAAAEAAYLVGLTTLPRFQAAIDAKARRDKPDSLTAQREAQADGETTKKRLIDVLGALDPERRNRFLRLRARCVEMQRIATAVRGETHDASGAAQEFRAPALDKLLWVFLRLLLSQQAVERFLRSADSKSVDKNLAALQEKQRKAQQRGDERMLRSIVDAMATAELRRDNHEKARGNSEFISLELDRIEQKIHALTELAVSHADPDTLSAEVDAVADGMQQTEQTIRELQAITGLGAEDSTPSILAGDVQEAMER